MHPCLVLCKKTPFGQYSLLSATPDELMLASAVQTFSDCTLDTPFSALLECLTL